MLHDALSATTSGNLAADRRQHDRTPCPAEMTLAWHHDDDTVVRYRVIDAGDGGYRVRTSTPLLTGMTGTALRLLPEGRPLDHPVMVAWCTPDGGAYEVGLRVF